MRVVTLFLNMKVFIILYVMCCCAFNLCRF